RDHTAGGVGYEEPASRGHDAIGAGAIIRTCGGDTRGKTGKTPPNLPGKKGVPCGDHVDDLIGTIGEKVELGRRVDVTDVKRVQFVSRRIPGVRGDRNRLEKLDRPLMLAVVPVVPVVSAARSGTEEQEENDEKQGVSERARPSHGRTS